mmetsp:Transcript_67685/g.220372  ORF Transcript_67685/g.220372 Transcript_67685/m.220372 type:complete len:222 (-) Transcript_67685:671-1336(-)
MGCCLPAISHFLQMPRSQQSQHDIRLLSSRSWQSSQQLRQQASHDDMPALLVSAPSSDLHEGHKLQSQESQEMMHRPFSVPQFLHKLWPQTLQEEIPLQLPSDFWHRSQRLWSQVSQTATMKPNCALSQVLHTLRLHPSQQDRFLPLPICWGLPLLVHDSQKLRVQLSQDEKPLPVPFWHGPHNLLSQALQIMPGASSLHSGLHCLQKFRPQHSQEVLDFS